MSLRHYIQMFLSGWWIIAGMTLIGVGVAPFYSYSQPDVYESSATYIASSQVLTEDPGDLINSLGELAARTAIVSTYCEVLESKAILHEAATLLGVTPAMIQGYTSNCVVFTDSTVVQLTVQGSSPQLATDLANAIGEAGIRYVDRLQEVYDLQSLDPAVLREDPVAPDHQFNIMIAGGLGFLGGVMLTLLNWWLSADAINHTSPNSLSTRRSAAR